MAQNSHPERVETSGTEEVADGLALISERLVRWFAHAQRDLPWRRTPDPYAVWVSEIMLQQTQVKTVLPYYERFMARFPTVKALAEAPIDDVLALWAGLGYYSRARNLHRAAQIVTQEGRVPDNLDALLKLPGVGRYTAGAILSIAYNQPVPILDGNVKRVLCRLFGLRGDPDKAPLSKMLWERAEALIPEGQARDFNQAMMELGALVCTPLSPACAECPVSAFCAALASGSPESLPELARPPAAEDLTMVAGAVWRAGRVLLVRRPADTWWAGLWTLPHTAAAEGESLPDALRRAVRETVGLDVEMGDHLATITHGVTRYRITLHAFHCPCATGEPLASVEWRWALPEELSDFALPSPYRRIARAMMSGPKEVESSVIPRRQQQLGLPLQG